MYLSHYQYFEVSEILDLFDIPEFRDILLRIYKDHYESYKKMPHLSEEERIVSLAKEIRDGGNDIQSVLNDIDLFNDKPYVITWDTNDYAINIEVNLWQVMFKHKNDFLNFVIDKLDAHPFSLDELKEKAVEKLL